MHHLNKNNKATRLCTQFETHGHTLRKRKTDRQSDVNNGRPWQLMAHRAPL